MTIWDEHAEAALASLMKSQPPLTYEVIAERLNEMFDTNGFSKNSCIGKSRRIAGRKARAAGTGQYPRKAAPYRHPVAEKPRPKVTPGKVTLMQLDSHTCRWPVTDGAPPFLYCGNEPLESSPYCGAHSRIAYPAMGRR